MKQVKFWRMAFLRAYEATGDSFYLDAATAKAASLQSELDAAKAMSDLSEARRILSAKNVD